MKGRICAIYVLLASLAGCDAGISEPAIDCAPDEWRLCVTEDRTWGRRYCTLEEWEPICRSRECEPDAELECVTACDTTGSRRCEADGFWGRCNHEVCDGADNDCDGEVDEGLVRHCQCGCDAGEARCVDGAWGPCDAGLAGDCVIPPGGCGGKPLGHGSSSNEHPDTSWGRQQPSNPSSPLP